MGAHLSSSSSSSSSDCSSSCPTDRFKCVEKCAQQTNCQGARLRDLDLNEDNLRAILLEASSILNARKNTFQERRKALRCLWNKYQQYYNPYYAGGGSLIYKRDALNNDRIQVLVVVGRFIVNVSGVWMPFGWHFSGCGGKYYPNETASILDGAITLMKLHFDDCQCKILENNADWTDEAFSTGDFPARGKDVLYTEATRPYVRIEGVCDGYKTYDDKILIGVSTLNFPLGQGKRTAKVFRGKKCLGEICDCSEKFEVCLGSHKRDRRHRITVLLYECDKFTGIGDTVCVRTCKKKCGGCKRKRCRCKKSSSSSYSSSSSSCSSSSSSCSSSSSSCSSSSSSSSSSARFDVPSSVSCSCKNVVKIGHRRGCKLNFKTN